MNLPDLTGNEADVVKATEFRRKALVRMPVIEFLMERPELTHASWWLKNKLRLGHPKIWVELVDGIEAKNDLREAIYDESPVLFTAAQRLERERAAIEARIEAYNRQHEDYMAFYSKQREERDGDQYFDDGSYMEGVVKRF